MPSAHPAIVFIPQSIDFAKAKAKHLRKLVPHLHLALGSAQQATAKAMGHLDWHKLEEVFKLKRPATTREECVSLAATYLNIQREALLEMGGPSLPVNELIEAWRLTGFGIESAQPTQASAPASTGLVRSKGTVTDLPLVTGLTLEVLTTEQMHSSRERFRVLNLRAKLRNTEGQHMGHIDATLYKMLCPVSTWEFLEFADTLTHWDFERVKDFQWSFPTFADKLFDRGFLCCTGAELNVALRGRGLFQQMLKALMRFCDQIHSKVEVVAVEIEPEQYPEGAHFYSLPGDVQQELASATLKLERYVHRILADLPTPTARYTRQPNHPGKARVVR